MTHRGKEAEAWRAGQGWLWTKQASGTAWPSCCQEGQNTGCLSAHPNFWKALKCSKALGGETARLNPLPCPIYQRRRGG